VNAPPVDAPRAQLRPEHFAPPISTKASLLQRFLTMGSMGVKMMFFDKLKLVGTIFGVFFAVLLGNVQIGTFMSLLNKNRMFPVNAEVDVWITPPGTRQFQGGKPLNDSMLNRARATEGVEWAEPLVLRTAQVQLPNGGSEPVSVVGTRAPRFAGGPWNIVAGTVEALNQPDAMFFEDAEREKIGGINLGSVRELDGHKVQAVGFTYGLLPFAPSYAFAEQQLAREILRVPQGEHTMIMVGVKKGVDPTVVRARLQEGMADTKVMTKQEFVGEITNYIITGTQIGFSFGLSTIMGLLVGLITVALSMFSSVVDNMRQFGTLKAIGSRNVDLAMLLVVQSVVYGAVGSLFGLALVTAMAAAARNPQLTIEIPTPVLGITIVLMVVMCIGASGLALMRLRKLEPAMVFR
jgi:putative ABC transport system permease protein